MHNSAGVEPPIEEASRPRPRTAGGVHPYGIWLLLRSFGWLLALLRCCVWGQHWNQWGALAAAAVWLLCLAIYPQFRAGRGHAVADDPHDPFWRRPLQPAPWRQRWLQWESRGLAPVIEVAVSTALLLGSGGLRSPLHEFAQSSLVAPALAFGRLGAAAATGFFLLLYALLLGPDCLHPSAAQLAQWLSPLQTGALALLLGQLLKSLGQRQILAEQAARLQERQRWIQDLHDGAAQTQYALNLSLEGLVERARQGAAPSLERLERLMFLSRQSLLETRQAMVDPSLLWDDSLDVCAMVTALCRDLESISDLRFELDFQPGFQAADQHKVAAYRFIQEALSNVFKYSGAARAGVTLTVRNGLNFVEVWDAGRGFDSRQVKQGRGWASLQRRAESIGGLLSRTSTPGEGTRITIEWSHP